MSVWLAKADEDVHLDFFHECIISDNKPRVEGGFMCIPSLFITWNIKYTCVNSYPQPVQCCDVSSSVTEEAVVTLPVGPVAKIQLRIFFPLSGHAAILIHQVYYGFLDICPPRNVGRLKVFKELPHDYISKSTWTLQNCTLVWMMNI